MTDVPPLGDELYRILEKNGFFNKVIDGIVQRSNGLSLSSSDLEPILKKAVDGIAFKPEIKLTHHGLDDLIACPSCKPKLDTYVDQQVAARVSPSRSAWLQPLPADITPIPITDWDNILHENKSVTSSGGSVFAFQENKVELNTQDDAFPFHWIDKSVEALRHLIDNQMVQNQLNSREFNLLSDSYDLLKKLAKGSFIS
jgi:hypothetical protein